MKRHEPSHKNKLKISQNRSTQPEWARAKVARAALLESEAVYYISEARSTCRAKLARVERSAFKHLKLLIISRFNPGVQYLRSTGRARWLGSSGAKFHILSNFWSLWFLDLKVARLVEREPLELSEMGSSSFCDLFKVSFEMQLHLLLLIAVTKDCQPPYPIH